MFGTVVAKSGEIGTGHSPASEVILDDALVCYTTIVLPAAPSELFPDGNQFAVTLPDKNQQFGSCQVGQNFSGVKLLVLQCRALDLCYDAIVDSGASHNFVSQQLIDSLQKLQTSSNAVEVTLGGPQKLMVKLADGSKTSSGQKVFIQVILDSGQILHVECNVVASLCGDMVLGMPFLEATNPAIDWQEHSLRIADSQTIATVPMYPGQVHPSVQEVLAKSIANLAKQNGSVAWFTLIRNNQCIQTGLLASAKGTSDPFAAAPLAYHSLLNEYANVFELPGKPSPQKVAHRIDLMDEGAPAPRHCAYRMSPSELAESRWQIHEMLQKDGSGNHALHMVRRYFSSAKRQGNFACELITTC